MQNYNIIHPIIFVNEYNNNEYFIPITDDVIKGIFPIYYISNYGTIYNIYNGTIAKIYNNNAGYNYVSLKTSNGFKFVAVHRLVLSCFRPDLGRIDQKLDVNHCNGITIDNFIDNLEWCTRSENLKHAYKNNLIPIGENHCTAKISNETANKIIDLLKTGKYTSKEIVNIVGGNATTHIVDDIRKKQCWVHLSDNYVFKQRINRIFTENDIHNFCKYFESHSKGNLSINDLCRNALKYYNFEPDDTHVETLRKVYTKKYYKHIVSQYNF